MTSVPVIFLAFANDRAEGGSYLRNLPLELDGIRKAKYCWATERSTIPKLKKPSSGSNSPATAYSWRA